MEEQSEFNPFSGSASHGLCRSWRRAISLFGSMASHPVADSMRSALLA